MKNDSGERTRKASKSWQATFMKGPEVGRSLVWHRLEMLQRAEGQPPAMERQLKKFQLVGDCFVLRLPPCEVSILNCSILES